MLGPHPRRADVISINTVVGRRVHNPAPPISCLHTIEPENMLGYMAKGHQVTDGIKVAKSADMTIILNYLGRSSVRPLKVEDRGRS